MMGAGSSSNYQNPVSKKTPSAPALKIVILGDREAGKTSIFIRFLHNQFSPIYIPTKKVNIENMVLKVNQPSHALVSMTIWDVPSQEDIDLQSTYFQNMDGLVVVVDLTDETSIRMAPVLKQLAINRASVTGQDKEGCSVQVPVLLIGTKFDLIEERFFPEGSSVNSSEVNSHKQKKFKSEPVKPKCVQLLEEVADTGYFNGSAVVSAKLGDGSVHQALQRFVRQILEKHNIERRWKPVQPDGQKKSQEKQGDKLTLVGIPQKRKLPSVQFDEVFEQGQLLVTRVTSLAVYIRDAQRQFQELCVMAGVVTEDSCSLEDCLVGLREALASQNIKLKLVLRDSFCVLEAKAASEDMEIKKKLRYTLKSFNKEFSAICKTALAEIPTMNTSLEVLGKRVVQLCEDYKVPPQPGQDVTNNSSNESTCINHHLDAKTLSRLIEKNCAIMMHSQHQALEIVKTVELMLKKARTAFVW